MNSRKYEICIVNVHRESYMNHLRSKKHLDNMKQKEMIITEWLFKEPIENKIKKIYNSEPLRQLARDNIRLDDKQLDKQLVRRMTNP